MGLLSRLGRAAGAAGRRFGDGGHEMHRGLAYGGLGGLAGAPIGAMANPDDPYAGMQAGLALGVLGGSGAGLLAGAARKGIGMVGAGARDFAESGAEEAFARRLSAFPPRVQQMAQQLKPIVDEKGGADWSDLEQFGNVTPDELRDLSVIFSRGHGVSMAGHPTGGGLR